MAEVEQPLQIAGFNICVKFIAKSADIPEQYKFCDVKRTYSIKFDTLTTKLLKLQYNPWLNLRVHNKGFGSREIPHIKIKQKWCKPLTIYQCHKADLSHNTKNICEHIGLWIHHTAISATNSNISSIRLTYICYGIDSVNRTTLTNTINFEMNVMKPNNTLSKFLLEQATNYIAILPFITLPFFKYEKNTLIKKKKIIFL